MIATIVRIVLMTLAWAALQGSFGVGTLLLGALFSAAVLYISNPLLSPEGEQPVGQRRRPLLRTWRVLVLILVFLRELVFSAVEVVWYVFQPSLSIRPAIIKYPLTVETDREITTLANLISLTPGTLSMDVSPDRSALYIHAITVDTEDGGKVIEGIKSSLEKHVGRALGPYR